MTSPIDVICVQDLTYVNGEVLALYVGKGTFHIERWIDRRDGWDRFLFFQVHNLDLMGYMDGKLSLYELAQHCFSGKYFIRGYKEGQTKNSIHMPYIPKEFAPPRDSYLQHRTAFLDDYTYKLLKEIINTGFTPSLQLLSVNITFGPIQTLELS